MNTVMNPVDVPTGINLTNGVNVDANVATALSMRSSPMMRVTAEDSRG